jgi:Ca2+-binding EF-hand superfamily protein
MERMETYKPLVQQKMMEVFMSEHTNPTLYKEVEDEWKACFKECAKSNPDRVNLEEFKALLDKAAEIEKKRFGQTISGDMAEKEMWYKCYNKLDDENEGVSLMDFKLGDAVMKSIMFNESLRPLVEKMIKRMMNLRPETRQKMMVAMKSEQENPTLFKELMEEFMNCFNGSDANKDGKLDLKEFKAFYVAYYEAGVKRYGEAGSVPIKE